MAKATGSFKCTSCGVLTQRWVGQCQVCGAWNSIEERQISAQGQRSLRSSGRGFRQYRDGLDGLDGRDLGVESLSKIDTSACVPQPTGFGEVDRVLSGGLLTGSVTLVFGEPGIGKSTLLLQVLMTRAKSGSNVLLVSAEESASQVRNRASRLGDVPDELLLLAASDIDDIEDSVAKYHPELVVVDSIQAIWDSSTAGTPGTLAQIRACADRLVTLAKNGGPPIVIVGHVTKDGDLAGPRILEHLVDTVLSFEGDRHHCMRVLRAVKHRFGSTGEIGLFEMKRAGLEEVCDPGSLLLSDRVASTPGSVVTALMEGKRPLLVELQSLLSPPDGSHPRRSAQGIDHRRLSLLLAVLYSRVGLKLSSFEIFVSAAGGIRAFEPACDLALILSLASAAACVAVSSEVIAFGEVGLAGEIRQIPYPVERLKEAARLGFKLAIVPYSTPNVSVNIKLIRVRTVKEVILLLLDGSHEGTEVSSDEDALVSRVGDTSVLTAIIPTWSPT